MDNSASVVEQASPANSPPPLPKPVAFARPTPKPTYTPTIYATATIDSVDQRIDKCRGPVAVSMQGGTVLVAEHDYCGGVAWIGKIVRTVQDMRLGMTRREAYTAMAARSSVSDLKRFTKSIVQAEEFGVPVANVVRNMAKEMRTKRRFRAEAAALQIPVKMLFPLMVCIFPVLFVVVLYPVLSNIGATLAQH